MKASMNCIQCTIRKTDELYSTYEKDEKKRIDFLKVALKKIVKADENDSAPWISALIMREFIKRVNVLDYYEDEKHFSNQLIQKREAEIERIVEASSNPLKTALRYALSGNYIDYRALKEVSDQAIDDIIKKSEGFDIPEDTFKRFQQDLSTSKRMVYLTDNAGEIVFDKIMIKTIIRLYPDLQIDVIVRGKPIYNDATMADVHDIGLDKIIHVLDNGIDVPGTALRHINRKSKKTIDRADMIIAKGMGNFETLYGCKKNIYYAFLCKCKHFTDLFNLGLYESVFRHEDEIAL